MKNCIILFFVILFFSCGDDGPNCPGDIKLPVTISPYKLHYNIGDTITISSKFHKLLYDQKTEKFYDASKYNIGPLVSLISLDNTETNLLGSQVIQNSKFIKLDSSKMYLSYSGKENAITGEYDILHDSLMFKIILILNKNGNFWFKTESLTSGDSHLQNNYQFNCRGRLIFFNLESPKENNIFLMEKYRSIYPNDYYLSDSINRFYNYAGYCFEVR